MAGLKKLDLSKLVRLREERGWTKAHLADKAELSRTAYNNIENGKTANPNPKTLKAVADVLGVELSALQHEAVGTTLALLNLSMSDVAAVLREARQFLGDDEDHDEGKNLLGDVLQLSERLREDNQRVLESNRLIIENNRLLLEGNREIQELTRLAIESSNDRQRSRQAARYRQDMLAFSNILVSRLDALFKSGVQIDEGVIRELVNTIGLVKEIGLSMERTKPALSGSSNTSI